MIDPGGLLLEGPTHPGGLLLVVPTHLQFLFQSYGWGCKKQITKLGCEEIFLQRHILSTTSGDALSTYQCCASKMVWDLPSL